MPFENCVPIPALYFVWAFPRALTFYVCNHAPRSIPRVGPEALSGMMLMLKYLVKVY